ncbi:MAG: RNA polymerase sigma factor [Cyclobacteriaceae bacterium]
MNKSEINLVRELKEGKKKALRSLYEAHSIQVFNLAYRMTSSREDSEEIVQDTFIRLWKSRSGIDVDGKILGYIIVIARNLAIDLLKARRKRAELEVHTDEPSEKTSTTNDFYFEEASRQFDEAVANLPPKRREVFILKIHTSLTNKEIASKLNISETMVEKQIRLASNSIRELMESSR